uniref:NADH-ubiquinone oxidoreductase chain 4 n=1 Tax=Monolepta hieroglyphica TaxID=327932 RepID=A0A891T5A8_9CUCU|nr:NADH dehydrogenase subunit 4 [Monolepta hieroglyphica]QRM91330.1 NADH dehydrogenase subunit 4 [Monolepta hieroglyphica]QUA05771.1 NADH dehydrogenase subunit 4 [Monolepta hieroglyphica]UFP05641.1 NADH dehydrogenase subunit 4 [Monolepta hieroglyphica]
MMKLVLSLFMLIPMSLMNKFWLVQWFFFLLSFIFLFFYSSFYFTFQLSYFLGMDLLSYVMILLSFWICSLMILASSKLFMNKNYSNLFLLVLIFLMFSLFVTFSSMNLFVFYLFFEISLIPTLMLIIGWGYQPERLDAGIYLLFYTLLMSLPMMIMIFYLSEKFYLVTFLFLDQNLDSLFMYLCTNLVFFVKIPMFFLHLWLPKAHVEAPVSGSMILAGIMLKLGGYGLMRFMILFKNFIFNSNLFFLSISLIGGFFVSLICIRQSDMKSLIAYSSVSHMGLAFSGILTFNFWGSYGCLVMMVAHGLCSSGLFCLANIMYERIHSRSLYLNKGLLNIIPSLSLWWFLLVSSNMAAPPSFNLLGEIMLINSIIGYSSFSMIFLSLMSFFSAVYSLFLYSYTQHGNFYAGIFSFFYIYMREFLLLFLHWFPLNILFLKMELLVQWI